MFKDVFSNLLQERNTNTSKLSKEIGISEAVLSKWKNGKTNPNYDNIKKLSQYFKVSINYLFEIEEETKGINISNNENVHNNNIACKNVSSNIELSYLEMELIQEIKKLSKKEQIQLLSNLNEE